MADGRQPCGYRATDIWNYSFLGGMCYCAVFAGMFSPVGAEVVRAAFEGLRSGGVGLIGSSLLE